MGPTPGIAWALHPGEKGGGAQPIIGESADTSTDMRPVSMPTAALHRGWSPDVSAFTAGQQNGADARDCLGPRFGEQGSRRFLPAFAGAPHPGGDEPSHDRS